MPELQKVPWPDWEIIELIGSGSFGSVYKIQRTLADGSIESAALKVITIPKSPTDIEEMRSEGYDRDSIIKTYDSHLKSIAAEYTHMQKMEGSSNIVNCKDIYYVRHSDGIGWDAYIRMELLTPLLKALPDNIPEEMVVRIGKDICKALVLCKKHEIVHRDIKPQNIFVSANGDYKLGDFGIAKTMEKTMGGTRIGTFSYMAPEVFRGQAYGSTADIYSLGIVLYWLLNERCMPFVTRGNPMLNEEAKSRRLTGEPLPAPAHGSAQLQQIVLKACAYNTWDRYASAEEMLSALTNLHVGASPVHVHTVPEVHTYGTEKEEQKETCRLVTDYPYKHDTEPTTVLEQNPMNVPAPAVRAAIPTEPAYNRQKQKTVKAPLVIAVVAMFLVILSINGYLIWQFTDSDEEYSAQKPENTIGNITAETTTAPEETATLIFLLDRSEIQMTYAGESYVLYSGDIPVDRIIFSSDNESIAVISEDGVVTAVAEGETVIHAQYGDCILWCRIICKFENEISMGSNSNQILTTAPTEESSQTPPTTQGADSGDGKDDFAIDFEDLT